MTPKAILTKSNDVVVVLWDHYHPEFRRVHDYFDHSPDGYPDLPFHIGNPTRNGTPRRVNLGRVVADRGYGAQEGDIKFEGAGFSSNTTTAWIARHVELKITL